MFPETDSEKWLIWYWTANNKTGKRCQNRRIINGCVQFEATTGRPHGRAINITSVHPPRGKTSYAANNSTTRMPETPKLPTFPNKSKEMRNIRANVNRQNILLINFELKKTSSQGIQTRGIIDQTQKQKKIRFSLDIWYLISRERTQFEEFASAMCLRVQLPFECR